MALYQFQAISERGKKVEGVLTADNLQEAKNQLLRRQIAAIRIELFKEKRKGLTLSKKELLGLTREMMRLLQAGLPLFEVLSALEEKYRGQKIHILLLDLCDQVKSGQSFSRALARHSKVFDLLFVAMVANAEKTGRLEVALEEVASLLSRQIHVRKQLLNALLYPSLLSVFCLVVLSSLLFFVIPSLKELFEGRDLHPFTHIVFTCSAWACQAKGFLLFFLLLSLAGGVYLFTSQKGKQFLVHTPLLKNFFAKLALARFCRATATLLEGGVPILAAFAQARGVVRHLILEKVIATAEVKIAEGEPLHVPFQNHPLIPPLVPRMIAIAQQGGKLPYMMQQMAQIYEEELETVLTHFATLAQPILLLILGGLVGFVLLSVLLPLTDVSSFVT